MDENTQCYKDISFSQIEMEYNSSQHLRGFFMKMGKLNL